MVGEPGTHKDLRRSLVAVAVLLVSWNTSTEGRSGGSVHVHGYTTRSGHYVAPYTRSAPHTYHAPAAPRAPHPSTRSTSLTSHPRPVPQSVSLGTTMAGSSGARLPGGTSSITIRAPRRARPRARAPATPSTTSYRSNAAGPMVRATCSGRRYGLPPVMQSSA